MIWECVNLINSEKSAKTEKKQGELIFGLMRKENITLRVSIYCLLLHSGYYIISMFI